MSDYIANSEGLLTEILKRLPANFLLKCRCVCKSWFSLISSSEFISVHLIHQSVESNDKIYSLVKKSYVDNPNDKLVLYSDNGSAYTLFKELNTSFIDQDSETDELIKMYGNSIGIVGCCKGLVCVCVSNIRTQRLFIWNPAIGVSVEILTGKFSHALGFGFDSKSNDYKVVRVVYERARNLKLVQPAAVQIYELSSKSWRNICANNLTFMISHNSEAVYLDNVLHWNARSPSGDSYDAKDTIASFHLGTESFQELVLPDVVTNFVHGSRVPRLMNCNQSLAYIVYGNHGAMGFSDCCIWVMSEYGVSQSWSKKFTVNSGNHGGFMTVLGFGRKGEILLHKCSGNEMASYDTETQRLTNLGVQAPNIEVSPYMESLVLLKGLNATVREPSENNN